jgi:hypothetical protein
MKWCMGVPGLSRLHTKTFDHSYITCVVIDQICACTRNMTNFLNYCHSAHIPIV